jgi:hypothetical protein
VTTDALRLVAVLAAVALVAAPYWPAIKAAAARALEAGKEKAGLLMRVAAAALLIAAAWGKVPLPQWPAMAPVSIAVETPTADLQHTVAPIAEAMKAAPLGDRMLWAAIWQKSAVVVAGDAVTTEVAFTDTRSLRLFTVLALDLGWRRIGDNKPGKYADLRTACEAAFASVLGTDIVPVTPELRQRYADLCRAIAWAALPPKG